MGKLPQLDVEAKRTTCLSSAHPLPKRRASRAWLPPEALGRRTVFLAGTESGSLKAGDFKTSRVLGA